MSSSLKEQAKELLAQQSTGPCVMLAYCWANVVERRSRTFKKGGFLYDMLIMDPAAHFEAVPYYAVIRTNRTGQEIYSLPGGGQDVLFFRRGVYQSVELGKPAAQADYLRRVLSVPAPDAISDEDFVSILMQQDDVTDITIESVFNAAAREAEEEHGWSYAANRHKLCAAPFELTYDALLKRSFEFDPPRPVTMNVAVAEVSDFEGTVPWMTQKRESKMKGRKGQEFFEIGNFACLDDLKVDFAELSQNLERGKIKGTLFEQQAISTRSRVEMIEHIEREYIIPRRADAPKP